jgi:RND family efflux transporter MFP subunit
MMIDRFRLCRFLAVVLAAGLLVACSEEPPTREEVSRPVKMMTLGEAKLGAKVEYPGEIRAVQRVEMSFEVPGRIIELPIDDGMAVEKGDLLAKLDERDFLADRDRASAQVRATRSESERSKRIFNDGAGSQAEVDRSLRDYEVAQENLNSAQKALEDTELVADFSGRVARKMVDNFQNIQAKETILSLQDTSSLELDVSVPESDFARIRPGDSVDELTQRSNPIVSLSSVPGREFPAVVKSYTTNADPVTRTYKATFAFANPGDVNILPGMTARVTITPSGMRGDGEVVEREGWSVPVASVGIDPQGESYVWRINPDDMRATKAVVELGPMSGSTVVVVDGLSPGETIATTGAAFMYENMLVRQLED